MIPILLASQIKDVDDYTIKNTPIASIDLMEQAASAFTLKFTEIYDISHRILIFASVGNNGGDAMAIARMLLHRDYKVDTYIVGDLSKASEDFRINYLRNEKLGEVWRIRTIEDIPHIDQQSIVIDGLFGSGLSRPIAGIYADLITAINLSSSNIVSIDIASGLPTNGAPKSDIVIKPTYTITFQIPKLSQLQPELGIYIGQLIIVNIGLLESYIHQVQTDYYLTDESDIRLPKRNRQFHKGDAGKILLAGGSKGKIGSITLAAKGAMRSGCGLLFIHTPCCGLNILQVNMPEAMVIVDEHTEVITEIHPNKDIDAIGIGPGIGTGDQTAKALEALLKNQNTPMVLDADALNILSKNKKLLKKLPKQSILTPHPGEFARLVGSWTDDFHKLELLKEFSKKHKIITILKGAHTAICSEDGTIFFNATGNEGMATAGSGDVLTGIITALLGQKLSPLDAARTGVYIHGLAGDYAAQSVGTYSLIASDIVDFIPDALMSLLTENP